MDLYKLYRKMLEQLTINIALGNPIGIIGMNVNDMLLALKYGADPNQTNQDGDTPLMFASRNGRAEIVELLLHMEQTSIKPI